MRREKRTSCLCAPSCGKNALDRPEGAEAGKKVSGLSQRGGEGEKKPSYGVRFHMTERNWNIRRSRKLARRRKGNPFGGKGTQIPIPSYGSRLSDVEKKKNTPHKEEGFWGT